jgi:hypothetical protein
VVQEILGAEVWFNELRLAELDNKRRNGSSCSLDANMARSFHRLQPED